MPKDWVMLINDSLRFCKLVSAFGGVGLFSIGFSCGGGSIVGGPRKLFNQNYKQMTGWIDSIISVLFYLLNSTEQEVYYFPLPILLDFFTL